MDSSIRGKAVKQHVSSPETTAGTSGGQIHYNLTSWQQAALILTLCVWMNSAGEGTRAGQEGGLCPLVGPQPEGGEASGSRCWLTLGPGTENKKVVISCALEKGLSDKPNQELELQSYLQDLD